MKDVERLRAMYEGGKFDHLFRKSFGYFPQTMERWKREGMPEDAAPGGPRFNEYFGYDELPWVDQGVDLGGCEAPLCPRYEEKVLREEDGHEIVQDFIGRVMAYPKGQREQVMPTFLKHAVASRKDWEEEIKPRLNPDTLERWTKFDEKAKHARESVARGEKLRFAKAIGGYMYLRSLVGPVDLLYLFYDHPDLVEDMMKHWRDFMVKCLVRSQQAGGPFFRLFLYEDICYKTGPLISPEMMKRFLMPYYRELYQELQSRQREKLHFEVDTDGDCRSVMDLYIETGVDGMSPFEVAAGCDVVEIGKKYPKLFMSGGIDKRALAKGPRAIDAMMERIMPTMVKRGLYVPTVDHTVPDDVSLANYLHWRKRMLEMDGRQLSVRS